jgi:peroxiredoxin
MNITPSLLEGIITSNSESILKLSKESPILLVFLRHFGCIFCKESLHDISKRKKEIEAANIKIVFVHMAAKLEAEMFFTHHNIDNPVQIPDPLCKVYAQFGLVKGTFSQLFGLKTWIRGAEIVTTKQQMPGLLRIGDGLQMPGIFLIKNGEIISSFIHKSVADKPNYEDFVNICRL